MKRASVTGCLAAAGLCMALLNVGLCHAAAPADPVGLWHTVDDSTGKARAVVRIERNGSVLTGTLVKVLDPSAPNDARCEKCPGERRNNPIVGLIILTGLRQRAADRSTWDGGEILDPDSGTLYRARVRLSDDDRHLEVRGFVGIALLGRTQIWRRAEP